MDYGKEKFGGPFTEEEVEDVKTVLRLLPLVICLSLSVGALSYVPHNMFRNMTSTNANFLVAGYESTLLNVMKNVHQLTANDC